ncbi:hypothetical protein AVEN_243756-1 [Araneus ventricosus]|uniref:Uncharacterized protein n=1 Tax=Araneus ventricosus TaxID=182803 RepID=A0A4Y2A5C8_ARAVE|nr:hypothetical protein AVEN_243756-1 [Araneus ventricosus]
MPEEIAIFHLRPAAAGSLWQERVRWTSHKLPVSTDKLKPLHWVLFSTRYAGGLLDLGPNMSFKLMPVVVGDEALKTTLNLVVNLSGRRTP